MLHTSAAKAVNQIERRDAQGAERYRAELRYHHYKPRIAFGMVSSSYYQGTHTLPVLPGASAYPWTHGAA